MYRLSVLILLFCCSFAGCTVIGPSTIERDRFDYSSAIAESWKKMMLLNVVKIRYGDTPIFLEVGSIVNQYSLEQELQAGAEVRSDDLLGDGVSLGAAGTYYDRPTITYTPLSGKKFAKSLLAPIPPHAILTLVQSGWNVDFIFRICLSAINDLYNTSRRQMIMRNADENFNKLVATLSAIQRAGGMGARLIERDGSDSIVFFRRLTDGAVEENVVQAIELMGLRTDIREFKLAYGSSPSSDSEIAMLTRSMLDIIGELAYYIQIPESHIEENRASPGISSAVHPASADDQRVVIHSSTSRPEDAFIAIEYRDHWFFIEDTDFRSKRIFSFLLFLFTLAESGSQGLAPILTLPAG